MKKHLFLSAFLFCILAASSQETNSDKKKKAAVKWAPTGLLVGSASFQGEYNFSGKRSLTAKVGLPVTANRTITYDGQDAKFDMKARSFLAGFRNYLSKKHMRGFYLEPFVTYVEHSGTGLGNGTLNNRPASFSFTNEYKGIGGGLQLGAQFFIAKRVVVDVFFLGPQYTSSTNNFKATEVSNSIPWTFVDAAEAEKEIKDFFDQFPIIRNKVAVTVEKDAKRVNADFKGALPGIRTGISIGFAF